MLRCGKLRAEVVLILFFTTTILFYISWYKSMAKVVVGHFNKGSSSGKPQILMWIPTYHARDWTIPNTNTCGGGCTITSNREQYESSDAVVFYMKGTEASDVPNARKRRHDQVFVWWCHESPWTVKNYWHKTLDQFDGYFNWTMHYRSDATVTAAFMPHTARDWYFNRVGRSHEPSTSNVTELQFEEMFAKLIKVKSKSAAWVVSDCNDVPGAKQRMKFARKIQSESNYTIDIFGKCGKHTIPSSTSVLFDILQTYRFYLAFENTRFCQEYVTEKFWYNSLYAGTVPIVWGPSKAIVEKLAPPNSFIHVEDFDGNVAKLVDYLRLLEVDNEKYKEYFRWWRTPSFYPLHKLRPPEIATDSVSESEFDYEVNGFCHLCKLLKERKHKLTSTIIPSLKEAFYGPESANCMS